MSQHCMTPVKVLPSVSLRGHWTGGCFLMPVPAGALREMRIVFVEVLLNELQRRLAE
jgi:hypothetical protein